MPAIAKSPAGASAIESASPIPGSTADNLTTTTTHPLPVFPDAGGESAAPFQGLLFLVVDDHPDGRFLFAKTLLRKFRHSSVLECETAEAAFRVLEKQNVDLIVSHRTFELDGVTLVRELRKRAPQVPLLMTSGINRRDAALAAGADAFLTYDAWLMIGSAVVELLGQRQNGPR